MKKMLLLIVLHLTIGFSPARLSADAPVLIPVQGYLTDANDAALDGEYAIVFSIYDVPAEGEALFSEEQTVSVNDGFFTVYLGDRLPTDLAHELFRDHQELFLGIKVEEDPEGEPRLQLAAAPYASFAQFCGDAATIGGSTPEELMNWDNLSDVPEGLNDGDNDTNAATMCDDDEYLDGDGSCKSAPVDSNAATICPDDNYLNGDGNCVLARPLGDITGIGTADDSGLSGGCDNDTCDLRVEPKAIFGEAPARSNHSNTSAIDLAFSSTYTTLASVSIEVERPGLIVVIGSGSFGCSNCTTVSGYNAGGRVGIDADEAGTPPHNMYYYVSQIVSRNFPTITAVYEASSSGTNTFYLRANRYTGSTDASLNWMNTHITAFFIPN